MSGFPNYRILDSSSYTDARNTGPRRFSPVGTLVHTTAGIDSLYWLTVGAAKSGQPASCDWLIARDGTRTRICPAGRYPYHAGQAELSYNDRLYRGPEISQLLMGVELENLDSTLCTWAQLDSLAQLVVDQGLVYGWRWPYYVLGHYEVARPLGRRSDPQGFLWGDFMGRLFARAQASGVQGLSQ